MNPGNAVTDNKDTSPSGLDQILAMLENGLRAPMGETLSFHPVHAEAGRVVVEGQPDRKVHNPMGSVHGGYAATLLDTACGLAAHTTLGPGRAHTTLELKVSYIRGLTDKCGTVRATGTVVSAGRRVAFCEATLEDEQGRLCATATSTLLLFDVDPSASAAFAPK